MLAAFVLAVTCAGATPAATNPYLPALKRLFQDMEYEEALRTLDRAAAWQSNTPADDVEVALYEGIICSELVQEERALRAFKRALAINPSATMPVAVSPKVTALVARARKDLHLPAAAGPKDAPTEPAAEVHKGPSWFGASRTAGVVVGAVGVASVAGAVALGVLAGNEASGARNTPQVDDSSYRTHRDNANHFALGANVLYGAAGVSAAVAIVLLVAGGPATSAPPVQSVGVSPMAGGAVISIRGGF